MEIIFLDEDFEELYVLDTFKSLIWTERFWKTGDFDLSCGPTSEILNALANTEYFRLGDIPVATGYRMRKETVSIKSDPEEGDLLIVQGRDLSSILDQRVIWNPTIISGNLQTGIIGLINDALITATDTNRRITNFDYIVSTDPLITALVTDTQFQGESLLSAIEELCMADSIGFRTFWNATSQKFQFKLLAGVDRSYTQTTNPTVAFTTSLENLLNANYIESGIPERNVCLIVGEQGVGNIRTAVSVGTASGLARKECYVEANINRNTPAGEMTQEEYEDALLGKGWEELGKRPYLIAFDGEVDTTMYSYGDAFSLGDIIQIADDYGHSGRSRAVEVIYAQDSEGIRIFPTFEHVE